MAKVYGFGIVGSGMIANFHADAIKQLGQGKLVGVVARNEDRVNAFVDKHGGRAYTNLDDFLSNKDIDIVTICTPSGSHMEPTVEAAKHGKHVLCEKPMEVTLDRVDQMIQAHLQAGTTLGGIFNSRFEPVNQVVKRLVRSGRMGSITYAGGYVPWWRTQDYYDQGGWRGTWQYDGGGALMNQGTHTVDLVQWLVGEKVKRVTAFTATLAHRRIEVEDTATAALQFANGALGILLATTSIQPGLPARVELGGTGGTIISESTAIKFLQFADPRPEDAEILAKYAGTGVAMGVADPKAITADNHRRNFDAFIEAIEHGRRPELDGFEGRKAVQIVTEVYESARTGKPVMLD